MIKFANFSKRYCEKRFSFWCIYTCFWKLNLSYAISIIFIPRLYQGENKPSWRMGMGNLCVMQI